MGGRRQDPHRDAVRARAAAAADALHKLDDGINAAPQDARRCWFDAEQCTQGIEALRQYRREWDDKKRVFRDTPRHDWASHSADAFRYLAMAWREIVPEPAKPAPKVLGIGPHNTVTLDDMWEANKPKRSGGRI